MGSVRSRRITISVTYHLTVIALALGIMGLGEALLLSELTLVGAGIIGFHIATFKLVRGDERLHRRIIRSTTCDACHLELELFNWWRCHCGYLKERHVLDTCYQCSPPARFAWIVCPQCKASLDL